VNIVLPTAPAANPLFFSNQIAASLHATQGTMQQSTQISASLANNHVCLAASCHTTALPVDQRWSFSITYASRCAQQDIISMEAPVWLANLDAAAAPAQPAACNAA